MVPERGRLNISWSVYEQRASCRELLERRHTFREHKSKAGVQKRHKTGGGGGFRESLMEKMTFEMLFGG